MPVACGVAFGFAVLSWEHAEIANTAQHATNAGLAAPSTQLPNGRAEA
ncbi:hypothetical protein [Mycobacterium bourgelatii]|nr:hypothetical protein [Mycobacterium bourgelatii]